MTSRRFPTLVGDKGISISCFIVPFSKGKMIGPIKFIIDTGSPVTGICEVDAAKFDIDIKTLPQSRKSFGSLSGNIQAHELGKTKILIKDSTGKIHDDFDIDMVYVFSKPICKRRREESAAIQSNLLGRDFLEKHSLKFFVDIKNGLSYIEE